MQKYELVVLLEGHGVPLHTWSESMLDRMLREIEENDVVLATKGQRVIRMIHTAAVDIYYRSGNQLWYLVEDRQVLRNGVIRHRKLNTSLGEKVKLGETPEHAARRALREELGIRRKLRLIPRPEIKKGARPHDAFPGVRTENTLHCFDVRLPKTLFKPEGYTEKQPDKTTYFIWQQVLP